MTEKCTLQKNTLRFREKNLTGGAVPASSKKGAAIETVEKDIIFHYFQADLIFFIAPVTDSLILRVL